MYYYGGNSGCGCNNQMYQMPCYQQTTCGNNSNYAIILVLFILLVIVLTQRNFV